MPIAFYICAVIAAMMFIIAIAEISLRLDRIHRELCNINLSMTLATEAMHKLAKELEKPAKNQGGFHE